MQYTDWETGISRATWESYDFIIGEVFLRMSLKFFVILPRFTDLLLCTLGVQRQLRHPLSPQEFQSLDEKHMPKKYFFIVF